MEKETPKQQEPAPIPEWAKSANFGVIVYQHVAAVLSAFALISFLGHFVVFDWRGPIAELVGLWAEYVRPVVKWLFDVTLVALVEWAADISVTIPDAIQDYIGVGIVLLFSSARTSLTDGAIEYSPVLRRWLRGWHRVFIFAGPILIFRHVALWPLEIWKNVKLFFSTLRRRGQMHFDDATSSEDIKRILWLNRRLVLMRLAPVFYLFAIFAANLLLR